jgi:fermentation-respiration switch protein FrsA (DUF1100 family)
MNAFASTCIVFACISIGILVGAVIPGHRMDSDTKDVVRLGTGLIGTLAALVLGLLIGSAKESYDFKIGQVRQLTADLILLDQILAQYGPDAHDARAALRQAVPPLIGKIWRENNAENAPTSTFRASSKATDAFAIIQNLPAKNDVQRSLQSRAVQLSTDLGQTRLLLFEQSGSPIPLPFLAVLVFWLVILFCSFSLFAKPNVTIIASLLVFALSASTAIYLILELSEPFVGLIKISSEPLRQALAPL